LASKAFKGVICDIVNGNHGSALRAVVFLFFFGIGALEFAVCFIERCSKIGDVLLTCGKACVLRNRVLAVFGEVVVNHGPFCLAAAEYGRQSALLGGRVILIAETLAVFVDPHSLGQAVHLAGHREAAEVHAGDRSGLEVGTGPVCHLYATAVIR